MKKHDNKKKHVKFMETRFAYYFGLGFTLSIYFSILLFQILRWIGLHYNSIFLDCYANIMIFEVLPTPQFRKIYYYYTGVSINNRLLIFMLNFLYWPVTLIWIMIVKFLSIFCYCLYFYIISIDLLLDLTRFFIFYADKDLSEFIRKHPVFDVKTEFLVEQWFLRLMDYYSNTVPSFYTYIFRVIFQKYDYICSVVWNYVRDNYEYVALIYTLISFPYFMVLFMWFKLNIFITDIAENYFSILMLFSGLSNNFLYWAYPWLYKYSFSSNFSLPTILHFLNNHRHPRGTNLIIFIFVADTIDQLFKTNILFSIFTFFSNLFFRIKNMWLYLKEHKFLLFILTVVFLGLPKIT